MTSPETVAVDHRRLEKGSKSDLLRLLAYRLLIALSESNSNLEKLSPAFPLATATSL